MKSYDLKAYEAQAYSTGKQRKRQPVIGVTANHEGRDATLRERYYEQVVSAGGTPVIIPPVADSGVIMRTLDSIDALLLTGGGDINPLWCGEEPSPRLHSINARRDLPELLITRLAANRQMPVLGICRGMQTLTLALGGTVEQDISQRAGLIKHSQDADRPEPTHSVSIEAGAALHDIFHEDTIYVNSFHHQAVSSPGKELRIVATAPDGTPEAVESSCHKSLLGVQWHPEWMGEDGLPLFRWLVDEARLYADARAAHAKAIILDSHCDTPMFFPQGADFTRRDSRILVDVCKMDDGGQDVATLAAYIPQPVDGETFADIAPTSANSPREYADMIFDRIESLCSQRPDRVAIARSVADIERNKAEGRKSVMLAIENALAIESDLDNIDRFADRGVVYITLCHNGDNLVCDSARKSLATHGGVSGFGSQVIERMNRCGVMVDLSHAAESSFYDAIDISRAPVVCSHSCCKAICDVPRNLTDDQLLAIARKDGVAQITLYSGFLSTAGNADIIDAINHIDHAVAVMGIDHVGIGTDFDGDGGVPGAADSSEVINITKQLLRRRYSPEEIAMIWGGNWLRVMEHVRQSAV